MAKNYKKKRPDFVLSSIENTLHIVEIKKSGYMLGDADIDRLSNYVDAFERFFEDHVEIRNSFPRGWKITLIVDGIKSASSSQRRALQSFMDAGEVEHITWLDFLLRAKKVHEQFLEIQEKGKRELKYGTPV